MSESRVVRILSKVGLAVEATTSTEENSIIREIISKSSKATLNGVGIENEIQVSNWLSFSKHAFVADRLEKLNAILTTKSYLVANTFTVADAAVFVYVSDNTSNLDSFPTISRWFNHIKRLTGSDDIPRSATVFPASFFTIASSSSATASTEAPAAAATASTAVATAAEPAAKASNKDSKENKKDSKAPAAAAAPKEDAAAPALDPSKLDIRVGLVVKCWNHPDSDKLLCEEIDVGEGSTRTIASGLRAFYKAEEVQGRKVMVLANLKERPMAGFMSQGMVLCAVKNNHSEVKLVEPPAAAQVGERVSFPGFNGEPALATHVAKKKILEGLAPLLRTNENGTALWNQSPFTLASGVCTAPLTDAVVS